MCDENSEPAGAHASGGPSAPLVPTSLTFSFVEGPEVGRELEASGFNLTIGRTRKSKLHIKDTSVSEVHAQLSWSGAAWVLRDSGSSNGTCVNGRRLQPMVDAAVLKDGDEVLFGLESKCVVRLTARTLGELTVGQLMGSLVEAAANRIEVRGHDQAKALLTELSKATGLLNARLAASNKSNKASQ
ncbi:hypothetical protein FOA52_008522 [Chlamydomonas sp. UWO 241]|nr:hypothetical protein FOA52_008522 [Chlamydomonas sp. UWO 241]